MAVAGANLVPVDPLRTLVDGIPTFYTDAGGRFSATLLFRAGRADERLPEAGVTHLVEHLAMPLEQIPSVTANASVAGVWTMFWAHGPVEAVVEHLEDVARKLTAPPLERLEIESRVLATEAGSSSGSGAPAYMLRFGARTYGLVGNDELGLQKLSAADVAAWAATFFTSGNAVLLLTGPPPGDLRLSLPRGPRRPVPAPAPIEYLTFPCAVEGPSGTVSLTATARRSTPLVVALAVAQERLRRALRHDAGLSYSVDVTYEPLTADVVHVAVTADTLEANGAAVRDRLLDVVRELAGRGPSEEELERERTRAAWALADPDAAWDRLVFAGTTELLGGAQQACADLMREYEQTTAQAAAAALGSALETALLVAPVAGPPPQGFAPYPIDSPRPVAGRRYHPRGLRLRSSRAPRLVAGADGVAWEHGGSRSAVRFDECEAVVHDGRARVLWSSDGFAVHVDPRVWRRGEEIVELVDGMVPQELHVPADREHAARAEALARAVPERIGRSRTSRRELDALPDVLAADEEPRLVVRADKGWRRGVLAITDRRALFVFLDEVLVDVRLDAIRGVARRSDEGALALELEDGVVELTNVEGAALEVVSAVLLGEPAPDVDDSEWGRRRTGSSRVNRFWTVLAIAWGAAVLVRIVQSLL